MDISQINWAYMALGVSAVLLVAWIVRAVQTKPGAPALFVGFAHLLVAGLNSAAPVRGALDPAYVGYGFGLLSAERGLAVTLIAGAVWIVAVLGAFLSQSVKRGAMLFVAASSTAFAVILGAPLVQGMIKDPTANSIQFGEHLTIPGLLATVLILALLVLPFAVGAVWATLRALANR